MKAFGKAASLRTTASTVALALGLSACAGLGEQRAKDEDVLAGRLSVRVEAIEAEPAHSLSAGFELTGNAERGSLTLSTPLGTVLAQARWTPQQAMLTTPRGQTPYADMPALTRALLGEELPLAALFDWLRGRPWPGAGSAPSQPPDRDGFSQLGWQVSLARFAEGLVEARRAQPPAVTVRAMMERP